MRTTTVALLTSLVLSAVLPLRAASVSIARWRGGATAAYSINMDDYGTQYFGDLLVIDSTLDNRGLNVSFATIANWSACNISCQNQNWGRARTMLAGNEFVNHTLTHPTEPLTEANYATEIDSSQKILEAGIPDNQCMFLVFSGGSYSDGAVAYMRSHKYIGCQSGGGGVNPHVIADPFRVKADYYSGGGLSSLNDYITSAVNSGGWAMRSCHNVGSGGWMPIASADWTAHLNFVAGKVADGSVWMAPVQEVLEYALEREHFPVAVSSSDVDSVVLTINTSVADINPSPLVDNTVYDTRLTLVVDLDFAAAGSAARQGQDMLDVTVSGASQVMVDAAPWGGPVIVLSSSVSVGSAHPAVGVPAVPAGAGADWLVGLDGRSVRQAQRSSTVGAGVYLHVRDGRTRLDVLHGTR